MPPLLMICNRENLPDNFIGQLPGILAHNYPVKIIVFDNGAFQPDEPAEVVFGIRNALLQAAQSSSHTHVFMGSAGNRQTLFDGLLRGIRSLQPALFLLYCPEPRLHRLPALQWPPLHELVLNSRAVPFFRLNPDEARLTRAAGISLGGNPAENEAWTNPATGDETPPVTFADWLFSLAAWEGHFRELAENDPPACPIHEYLALDTAAREGKTGVIFRPEETGTIKTLAVSDRVADACRAALSAWNYLREMAGALSPHPQKLWEAAEATLSARYDARMQEIEQRYEDRIKKLEQEFLEKTREKLREKLLTLATHRS